MANVLKSGFRPIGTLSGSPLPKPLVRPVANNYGTALGIYDVVAQTTDGTTIVGAAATAGAILGVATGFSYVTQGKRIQSNYLPANTTFSPTTVGSLNESLVEFIPLTPDVICEVQCDDATTATTIAGYNALVGENCDIAAGTANSTTGISGQLLDISTHATATFNFRIIQIPSYSLETNKQVINDPASIYFRVWVVCNESIWPTGTATGV